jgi:TonB family protein
VLRTAQGQKPVPSPNALSSSSGEQGAVSVSATVAESGLVERVEPDYPDQARALGVQGTVVLEVHISPDGKVQDALVVQGSPLLTQASIAAVKQWRFKPHLVKGRPTAMQTNVTLNFRLPQQ